jgi:hypothetical protein
VFAGDSHIWNPMPCELSVQTPLPASRDRQCFPYVDLVKDKSDVSDRGVFLLCISGSNAGKVSF